MKPHHVAASDSHHKHKVQRSGCVLQRSGPASAQVTAGCNNSMQLQPPPPLTSSGSASVLLQLECTIYAAIIATSVREARAWKEFKFYALMQAAMTTASCTPIAPC